MKRFLLFLLIVAAGAYYVNQAGLVPGWPPLPLPDWVPAWARIAPQASAPGSPVGAGRRQGRGQGRFGQAGAGDGPVPVVVAASRYEDVPDTVDSVGTVQALNTVTVRPQVDGKLIELRFKDGQDVKKGDVLARIDPATYQAQYDQAVARKAQDEATLANARNDLVRYQKLASTEAGSKQQADTQKALVAQLEAQINGDQAAIDNAKAMLSYTSIVAPIDGRTGIRLVDEGNILHASDLTGIVVITQIKPINVIFNLPQQELRRINSAMTKGKVKIQALDSCNVLIEEGVVGVIDNQVDQTTGTIKLKADFPNADLQLWPGQFVNVRVFVDTLEHVVVVPSAAVQRGPNGSYVYVLNGNKASLRNVKTGHQNEKEAVILSGLQPPEQVVITGFSRLTDGAQVSVAPPEEPQSAPSPSDSACPEQLAVAGAAPPVAGPTAAPAPPQPRPGLPIGAPGAGPRGGMRGGGRRWRGQGPPGAPRPAPKSPAAAVPASQ